MTPGVGASVAKGLQPKLSDNSRTGPKSRVAPFGNRRIDSRESTVASRGSVVLFVPCLTFPYYYSPFGSLIFLVYLSPFDDTIRNVSFSAISNVYKTTYGELFLWKVNALRLIG